jgi:hypothetical protein
MLCNTKIVWLSLRDCVVRFCQVIEASHAIQDGLDGAVAAAVAVKSVSPPVEPVVIAEQVSFPSQHSRFTAHHFIFR